MDNDYDIVALAKHYYQQAQELKNAKRVEEAIRCLRSTLFYDPTLRPAYSDLTELFLSLDMAGQAMHTIKMAIDRFGQSDTEARLRDLARNAYRSIHHTAAIQESVLSFSVVRFLGAGWEGAVYLVKDSGKTKWIVKAFHPGEIKQINYEGIGGILRKPLPSCRQNLELLAARSLQKPVIGTLYPLELINRDGQIVGIKYPYEHLWKLDAEMVSHPSIKSAILGAFFNLQALLINGCRLLLNDPLNGFMFNKNGDMRYIDYGRSIISIDDYRCGEDCLDAVSFFIFLFQLIEPTETIKKIMQRLFYPTHHNRAILMVLITEIKKDVRLKPILRDCSHDHLELFHDSGFYESLSGRFLENVSIFGKKYYSYRSILKNYIHHLHG